MSSIIALFFLGLVVCSFGDWCELAVSSDVEAEVEGLVPLAALCISSSMLRPN